MKMREIDEDMVRAFRIGDWEKAMVLFDAGANPYAEDDKGYTAFTWAWAHGHPQEELSIVRGMISAGRRPS